MDRRLSLLFEEEIDSLIKAPAGFCVIGLWTYNRPDSNVSKYWQRMSSYDQGPSLNIAWSYENLIFMWSERDLIRPLSPVIQITYSFKIVSNAED